MQQEASFSIPYYIQDNNISIHIINVQTIDEALAKLIDEHLVKITQGIDEQSRLFVAKQELLNFFDGKDQNKKIGATAEFFIHLYLNKIGFEQQCLFLNLEEKSVKKGFDGYYTLYGSTWIMESKSGLNSTIDISHGNKIQEACGDLNNKLQGNVSNNPWKNAFNHAKMVNANNGILKELQDFSDKFINGDKTHNIADFNIIPCSTIFYLDKWEPEDINNVEQIIKTYLKTCSYKNIHAICLNKTSVDAFIDYLNRGDELYG